MNFYEQIQFQNKRLGYFLTYYFKSNKIKLGKQLRKKYLRLYLNL